MITDANGTTDRLNELSLFRVATEETKSGRCLQYTSSAYSRDEVYCKYRPK